MEGILALTEGLSGQSDSADTRDRINQVAEAAGTVNRIIAAGTDLHSLASGGLQLNAEPKRLRDVMDDLELRWRDRAADAGTTLMVSYDGEPEISATVDSDRILQVFDGLVAQAIAGAGRSAIEARLKVTLVGDRVHLEGRVRGGDREFCANELDIRQIDNLFGLEIAFAFSLGRHVVEALGGQMSAEPNPGGGSTLVFSFDAALAVEVAPAEEAAAQGRAAHILVVDDNATNRMVAETLCEMFDCTSETAEDGVEAVEAARSGRFDLILMDIKMPRMDGVSATRAIRQFVGPAGRVPIIALTANADPEDAAGYLNAGMNDVVEKPMKPQNLLRALQENLAIQAAAA